MTTFKNAITGQVARKAKNAFAGFTFALFFVLIINALAFSPAAASGPGTPQQGLGRDLSTCAGEGASLSVEMDAEYLVRYVGCGIEASLIDRGCYLNIAIAQTCIPNSGSWTIATILIEDGNGNLNSVWVLRAVDGLVDVLELDM